jgi:hypothetical protein
MGGELAVREESCEVRFFARAEVDRMDIHPSSRLRIRDFLERTDPALR